ncbi:MAG: hypothetical protein JSS66_14955 [Armatimonadetes bacterium]|nr:hypothetical protein [Armatimonadota bacterium]
MPVTTLLLASALAPIAYSFGPGTTMTYDVSVQFNGFLPVLGGNEGVVNVKMAVGVEGKAPVESNLQASNEIQEFELEFNGAKLPLDKANVVEYFPKTTIQIAPTGKILKTDAPDKKLPVKLPGLDVKHFPDITYVPIELPPDGIELSKSWTFKRNFGGSDISYTCTAESAKDSTWHITVKLDQKYTVLENSSLEVVTSAKDAVSEVTTTMTGEGFVDFNADKGRVDAAQMDNKAVSEVKDLKSGETKQRKLDTKYAIKLKTGSSARAKAAPQAAASNDWWGNTVAWTSRAVNFGKGAVAWVQMAAMFGLRSLPDELEAWLRPFRSTVRRWIPMR